MHVAVLGGTISGTVAAKQLALSGVHVDLFRNLNDPNRNINQLHPFCDYQTATFVLRDDSPSEFAEEVREWLDRGFVQENPKFWFGHVDKHGNARETKTPSRRFLPKEGFFSLLDSMMANLPNKVNIKVVQLVRLSRRSGKWVLRDRHGKDLGPYDAVMLAFDALPRAARKASQKQLLETALPHSSNIIASAARSQMCSSMAIIIHFDPPLDVQYDSILFDDVPELQFAARNPKQHQHNRGLREKHDTWTIVATPAWSREQRPEGPSGKGWDKAKVGRDMTNAFCRAMQCSPGNARQIIPTFHWEGCSYITQVTKGELCAFDAEVGLGWCGDMFGGMGPQGAFMSGLAAGSLVAAFAAGSPKSVLPCEAEWGLRKAQEGDEDILSIAGPGTGRYEPSDGLDHTWSTTVRIAQGETVQKADSHHRYRKQGPIGDERYGHKEGPWSDPSRGKTPTLQKLTCTKIDEGILKVIGLPTDMQSKLMRAVFPPGACGVCGGLYDARRGTIEVGKNKDWSAKAGSEVTWSELGLHGHHALQLNEVRGSIVEKVLSTIKNAVPPEVLEGFNPDSLRVSFENMHGRTIRPGQTLCGWSRDNDRVDDRDKSPKICIILGAAKIWRGFKYRKEDRESLDVDLSPGDVLVLYGPARSWVSAVNGFEPRKISALGEPFDFAHIWIHDHRRLQRERPEVYKSIHHPPTPVNGDDEYKWMQYAYTVLDKHNSDDEVIVEMSDGSSVKRQNPDATTNGQVQVAKIFQPPSRTGDGNLLAKGRRWQSKGTSGDQQEVHALMGA